MWNYYQQCFWEELHQNVCNKSIRFYSILRFYFDVENSFYRLNSRIKI